MKAKKQYSTRKESEELWHERLYAWKVSGNNIAKWCRDNEVSYVRFFYWKNRFTPEQELVLIPPKLSPPFIELTESPQSESTPLISANSGISLSFQKMHIHLSKDFDRDALVKCLNTLKML